MKIRDWENRFHSQQAADLSFKPKLFSVYRRGFRQLTVFPSCWQNQRGIQTQREEINSQESVCIFHVYLFISSHLQKRLTCQGLWGCEAPPLTSPYGSSWKSFSSRPWVPRAIGLIHRTGIRSSLRFNLHNIPSNLHLILLHWLPRSPRYHLLKISQSM